MKHGGDVVILGGGVIGLTTAYFLAREGVRVVLLDQGEVGREASWAGAGILPPSNWDTARHPFDRLRALSGRLFPDLSAELREQTGFDNGYIRCGGIKILRQHRETEHDDQEWAGEGIPIELVSDASQVEPAVAPGLGTATLIPTMAQLRNPRHLQALYFACMNSGKVKILDGEEAKGFTVHGEQVRSVPTSFDDTVEGATYVVAAGAWTDRLLGHLGVHIGIRPVRGQIVLLNPGKVLFRRVLIEGARYLVPRQDGRVLAGSTEEEVGFDKQTTAEGVAGLIALAVGLVPAPAHARGEAR